MAGHSRPDNRGAGRSFGPTQSPPCWGRVPRIPTISKLPSTSLSKVWITSNSLTFPARPMSVYSRQRSATQITDINALTRSHFGTFWSDPVFIQTTVPVPICLPDKNYVLGVSCSQNHIVQVIRYGVLLNLMLIDRWHFHDVDVPWDTFSKKYRWHQIQKPCSLNVITTRPNS